MSVGLLVTAGQMVKGLVEIKTTDYGFDRERSHGPGWPLPGYFPRRRESATGLPGVAGTAPGSPRDREGSLTDDLPGLGANRVRFELPGVAYMDEQSHPLARVAMVTPGFFETFGTSVLRGRDITEGDVAGAPEVALVNQSFVQLYLPKGDAIGAQLRVMSSEDEEAWTTIVGVVPDLAMEGIGNIQTDGQGIYLPLAQQDARFLSIAVRGSEPPLELAGALREEMAFLDPDSPLYWVRTMQEALDQENWSADVFGTLFGVFGLGALFLAAVGLYGVMAFSVKSRTQEVGIRIAMGAKGRDVMGMVPRWDSSGFPSASPWASASEASCRSS